MTSFVCVTHMLSFLFSFSQCRMDSWNRKVVITASGTYQRWARGGSWPRRPTVLRERWKLWCNGLSKLEAAGWGSTRYTCCPCCAQWEPRARQPCVTSPQSCAAAPENSPYSHLWRGEKRWMNKVPHLPRSLRFLCFAIVCLWYTIYIDFNRSWLLEKKITPGGKFL